MLKMKHLMLDLTNVEQRAITIVEKMEKLQAIDLSFLLAKVTLRMMDHKIH